MSNLIPLLAMGMALLQVTCADPKYQQPQQPLPYAASAPAGYHGSMPYGPGQAHFPQQPPGSIMTSIMGRLHNAKNNPRFAKTLNSVKPLVGGAARFAAPAINKATTWTKTYGNNGMMLAANGQPPAPYSTNPYPQTNLKPHGLRIGGPPTSFSHQGPTMY